MHTVFSIELESESDTLSQNKTKNYQKHLFTDKKNHKPKLEIWMKLNPPRQHHLTEERLSYPLFLSVFWQSCVLFCLLFA